MKEWNVDQSWTLFLDRDGVINVKRENDYVKTVEEFIFLEGAVSALVELTPQFQRTVVVTNQQGIGKQIMTAEALGTVHEYMEAVLGKEGVKLDAIYYCPELAKNNAACRKPNTGMALQAKADFPEIDFNKSIMVGDSETDIEMGQRAGMKTVFIHPELKNPAQADLVVTSLEEFQNRLKDN